MVTNQSSYDATWVGSLYQVGPQTHRKLKERGITPEQLEILSEEELKKFGFLNAAQRSEILKHRSPEARIAMRRILEKEKIRFLETDKLPESRLASRLKNIPDPPFGLFCHGEMPAPERPVLAVIGSRKPTSYGLQMAYELSYVLSHYFIIVSGMALGIDVQSHIAALDAGQPTIGVTGCGLDRCYPRNNYTTYLRMWEDGCMISEYAPGIEPRPWHFPMRNRIISGLADAVIVVEAAARSGTALTVETALQQGRDIFAVPGRPGDKNSEGCLQLIKDGAFPLTSWKDVLEHFSFHEHRSTKKEPSAYDLLLEAMGTGPSDIDLLMQRTGMLPEKIRSLLLEMELKGLIRPGLPGYYVRSDGFFGRS